MKPWLDDVVTSLYNQWRALKERLEGGLRNVSEIVDAIEQLLLETITRSMLNATRSNETIVRVAAETLLDRVRVEHPEEAWNIGLRLVINDRGHSLIRTEEVPEMRAVVVLAHRLTEDGHNTVLNSFLRFMCGLIELYEPTDS